MLAGVSDLFLFHWDADAYTVNERVLISHLSKVREWRQCSCAGVINSTLSVIVCLLHAGQYGEHAEHVCTVRDGSETPAGVHYLCDLRRCAS